MRKPTTYEKVLKQGFYKNSETARAVGNRPVATKTETVQIIWGIVIVAILAIIVFTL